MRVTALVLFVLVSLSFTPMVSGSITNKVNIQSNGGESNTKVEIHQSGEGTSKVNINGKEWRLEGPGDISVNEGSSPLSSPTTSPTPSPTVSPSPSTTPNPSPSHTTEQIQKQMEQIIDIFRRMLENLLKIF